MKLCPFEVARVLGTVVAAKAWRMLDVLSKRSVSKWFFSTKDLRGLLNPIESIIGKERSSFLLLSVLV